MKTIETTEAERLKDRWMRLGIIAFLSAVAVIFVYLITFRGIGVGTDSLYYIKGAKGAMAGSWREAIDPTGHFPPFYPWVMAVFGLVLGDALVGARVLNIFCGVITISLFVLLVLRAAPARENSWWRFLPAFFCGMALLMADDFLRLFALSYSESLFSVLILTVFLVSVRSQEKESRTLAFLAGFVLGLATVTRYAGLFFLPPIAAWMVLTDVKNFKKAAGRAFSLFVGTMLAPVLVKLISPAAPPRPLIFHFPSAEHWNGWIYPFSVWTLPYRLVFISPFVRFGVLFVVLATFVALTWKILGRLRKGGAAPGENIILLCLLSFFAYATLLMASITFFDFNTYLDFRILFPLHLMSLLVLATFLTTKAGSIRRFTSVALVAVLAFWILGQALRGLKTVAKLAREGMALTSKTWTMAPATLYLKNLPEDISFVSNKPDLLLFLLNKPCDSVPHRRHMVSSVPNPNFAAEIQMLAEKLRSRGTLLVWIPDAASRTYLARLDEIKAAVPLRKLPQSNPDIELYDAEN